jgi:DNA (cytosine-5)-methyltransferase 1
MKDELQKMGYHVIEKIMNSCEYGNVPQNRERLYIIAFLDYKVKSRFQWPQKLELTNPVESSIDFESKSINKKFFYTNKSKCYTLLKENILNNHSIYLLRRVYVRENKSRLCPTLTANMGTVGNNVPLIFINYDFLFGTGLLFSSKCQYPL